MSPQYRITLSRFVAGEGTASAPGVRVLRGKGLGVRVAGTAANLFELRIFDAQDRFLIADLTLALFFLAAPLHAHEQQASNLDVVLDRVTPQPAHLEVQIVNTLAPQMLISNRTGKTLEILDSRGIPVIRIAPDRTWVNASAPAYYSDIP